jgi:hypothetical protein
MSLWPACWPGAGAPRRMSDRQNQNETALPPLNQPLR